MLFEAWNAKMQKKGVAMDTPLMNFIIFLLQTCERKAPQLFQMLRQVACDTRHTHTDVFLTCLCVGNSATHLRCAGTRRSKRCAQCECGAPASPPHSLTLP